MCAVSNIKTKTHFFFFLRGLVSVRLVVAVQSLLDPVHPSPAWTSSFSLPSLDRSCFTLFIYLFIFFLTGTKRTATCCQLLWDATFLFLCSSSPSRWRRVGLRCCHSSPPPLCLPHRLCMWIRKPFEQLCAGTVKLSKDGPALNWHSTGLFFDT